LSRYLSVRHNGLILNTGRHSSRYVGLYLSKISTDFFDLSPRLVRLVYRRARNRLNIRNEWRDRIQSLFYCCKGDATVSVHRDKLN